MVSCRRGLLELGLVLLGAVSSAVSEDVGFNDSGFCSTPGGIIEDACGATFNAVEETNRQIRPVLKDLVTTDYFNYYKVDLSGSNCPFVDEDNGMCGNRACAVDPVDDESELPEFWRTQYLGKLAKDSYMSEAEWGSRDTGVSGSCVVENGVNNDLDYCYPEDESNGSPGVYVSLMDNPERFTGYSGAHAHKIWRAVYQENCFGYSGDSKQAQDDRGFSEISPAGLQLGRVIHDTGRYEMREVGGEAGRDAMNTEEQCIEQRLFYRLLSGMQASISTHLCYEHLNKTTGEWGPNTDCFMARVGSHPERVSNLYFNYALVSRAVSKLRNYIDDLHFCKDDLSSDQQTRKQLLKLTKIASKHVDVFNEKEVFATPEALALKSEFRKRVRKVNALMSCVGCDRCRLWGKLQTAGYGTALKILFELPERAIDDPTVSAQVLSTFRRSELVALINTFDRLSKSMEALVYFRSEIKAQNGVQDDKPDFRAKLGEQWDEEWSNFIYALKFIFRSYIEFPKNMWNLFIHYSAYYWNRFIGRDDYNAQATAMKLEL